jgi:hypothetical protein
VVRGQRPSKHGYLHTQHLMVQNSVIAGIRKVTLDKTSRSQCFVFALVTIILGCSTTQAQIESPSNTTSVPAPVAAPPQPSLGGNASDPPATASPTVTARPSFGNSDIPNFAPTVSEQPSGAPSVNPTDQPTFKEPILADARFRQKFLVGNGRIFNEDEISIFETLYQSYTKNFVQVPDTTELKIVTTCVVDNQEALDERRFLRLNIMDDCKGSKDNRKLQELVEAINMDYTMTYKSSYINVTSFPILFQNYINQNLETVTNQMQLLQLNVSEAQTASRLIVRTHSPTISWMPSDNPTGMPTTTPYPSHMPSSSPTNMPTFPQAKGSRNGVVIITVSMLIGISIVVIGLLIYCRKRRHRLDLAGQEDAMKHNQGLEGPPARVEWNGSSRPKEVYDEVEPQENHYGSAFRKYANASTAADQVAALSPGESRASNPSLLSAGNSMAGESGDEADTTQIIADEFDQYKDQNLEKMRADIEGNVEGCDGMMSQAVARALIEEEDLNFGATDYLWGGDTDVTGPEIEASALGDVTDWLKRNDKASIEEKCVMKSACRAVASSWNYSPFLMQTRIHARNVESDGRQCATWSARTK